MPSESTLAAGILKTYRDMGWPVWEEVPCCHQRFDAVVETPSMDLITIHFKTHLDGVVIEQARKSQGVCEYSLVGIPQPKRLSFAYEDRLARCERLGLGVLHLRNMRYTKQVLAPVLNAAAQPDILRKALLAHTPSAPAGSKHAQTSPESEYVRRIMYALARDGIVDLKYAKKRFAAPWSKPKTIAKTKELYDAGRFGKAVWQESWPGNPHLVLEDAA